MSVKTKKIKYAILPFQAEKIKNRYLVSNMLGNWDLITETDLRQLNQKNIDQDQLQKRLIKRGIVVDAENGASLINNFRNLHANLFTSTSLHIVVVTTRCNLACEYCQTKSNTFGDMDIKIAKKVLNFFKDCPSPVINLEFQGGEPLLNWPVVKFFIINVKKLKKKIVFSLVTNGILLDPEKIDFLIKHNVNICISLDGSQKVHDKNRVFASGKGTYSKVFQAIKRLKRANKKNKNNKPTSLLPTVTKFSLKNYKQIVDEYVKQGAKIISLRPVTKIGAAKMVWDKIGYTPEEFNVFWQKSMDYILTLNKKDIKIQERMVNVLLKKILIKQDPAFVDLMSPCGAGRQVLTYMPSGDIYPCDEARMSADEIFKLGNLNDGVKYNEVIKSPNLFSISCASLIQLWDYNSAFSPWIGTCPVLNYVNDHNLIPKITATPMHKIYRFQLRYLFTKMLESKENEKIFWGWVGKDKPDFSVHE